MEKARIAAGGLLAGAVINARLLIGPRYYDGSWRGVIWALNRTDLLSLGLFLLPGLVQGFCLMWMVAALAPRHGAGLGTAARAGLVTWLLADLPLVMEALVPYRFRPSAMLALDLALFQLAALVAAGWHNVRPMSVPGSR
jgi:hypothetical protein